MSRDRAIFCTYCEDIREELGGKRSFMGVFRRDMLIQSHAPVVLPKLIAIVDLKTVGMEPIKSIELRVMWNERVVETLVPPVELLKKSYTGEREKLGPEMKGTMLQAVLVRQPFEVVEDGNFRVSAIVDGEELMGNALRIKFAPVDSKT